MSGLSIFKKISEKLDEGWKLTNVNCPICNTTIIGKLKPKQFYCVKCEMPVKMEEEEEDDEEVEVVGSNNGSGKGNESAGKKQQDIEEFDNLLYQKENEAKRKRADELSKKMGEKLLQGWAMLEDSCFDCLFPLMRSKKGELVCVGCGPVDQKKEEVPQKQVQEEKKIEEVPKKEKKEEKIKEKSPEKKIEKSKEKVEHVPEPEVEKRDEKCPRHHKGRKTRDSHETTSNSELFELFQFNESISFYSKMTQLLSEDLDRLGERGLLYDKHKALEILEMQKEIDEEKIKILKQFRGDRR